MIKKAQKVLQARMADVIMERNCVESAQIVGQPHVESTSTCQSNLMLQIQNRSLIMETFYQQMEQSVTNLENFMKEDDKEVEAVFKDVTELFKKEKDPIITNELTIFRLTLSKPTISMLIQILLVLQTMNVDNNVYLLKVFCQSEDHK